MYEYFYRKYAVWFKSWQVVGLAEMTLNNKVVFVIYCKVELYLVSTRESQRSGEW